MKELHTLTAVQLRDAIRNGALTVTELAQHYLNRIAAYDGRLNTIAELNPHAMDEARAMDADPQDLPLFGLPILIKDNIDVAGLHTTAGSMALTDNLALTDAPIVANLKRNGALILGKTHMTELANYTSDNMPNGFSSQGGQVINAYHPDKDPSGSSTGSAVAVSAGFCAAAIGTDTSFSIVGCATDNGVTGFKPPHGALSAEGIVPICHTMDSAGPLTKTVEDAILIYNAMRDGAPIIPEPIPVQELRIAVNIHNQEKASELPDLQTLLNDLQKAGASISELDMSMPPYYDPIMRCEFREDLEEYLSASTASRKTLASIVDFYEAHPEHQPYGISVLKDALPCSREDADYKEAMEGRARLRDEVMTLLADSDACMMTYYTVIKHVIGLPSIALKLRLTDQKTPLGVIFYGTDETKLLSAALTIEQYCQPVPLPQMSN